MDESNSNHMAKAHCLASMTFCNGYRVFDNQICWFLNICNVVSTDTKKDAMITINDDNGDNGGENAGDGDDEMS